MREENGAIRLALLLPILQALPTLPAGKGVSGRRWGQSSKHSSEASSRNLRSQMRFEMLTGLLPFKTNTYDQKRFRDEVYLASDAGQAATRSVNSLGQGIHWPREHSGKRVGPRSGNGRSPGGSYRIAGYALSRR